MRLLFVQKVALDMVKNKFTFAASKNPHHAHHGSHQQTASYRPNSRFFPRTEQAAVFDN